MIIVSEQADKPHDFEVLHSLAGHVHPRSIDSRRRIKPVTMRHKDFGYLELLLLGSRF